MPPTLIKLLLIVILLITVFKLRRIILSVFLTIATPYNPMESAWWLIKYAAGPSKRNPGLIKPAPHSFTLNKNAAPVYTLTFGGDIMPCHNKSVHFSPELIGFLKGSDYFIANLEGTITDSKKDLPIMVSDRRHDFNIITTLSRLFPPEKTFLSVANNHSGDFGQSEFFNSIEILKSHNFNVFGQKSSPSIDLNPSIRVTCGTAWSNRKCDYVSGLDKAAEEVKPNAFNFLYAHFGYEFELFPRISTITASNNFLHKFDALVGHHSHCPQPVVIKTHGEISKLLAYSLGNLLGAFKAEKYRYGIILKAAVGEDKSGRWLIERIEWKSTNCSPQPDKSCLLGLCPD